MGETTCRLGQLLAYKRIINQYKKSMPGISKRIKHPIQTQLQNLLITIRTHVIKM